MNISVPEQVSGGASVQVHGPSDSGLQDGLQPGLLVQALSQQNSQSGGALLTSSVHYLIVLYVTFSIYLSNKYRNNLLVFITLQICYGVIKYLTFFSLSCVALQRTNHIYIMWRRLVRPLSPK